MMVNVTTDLLKETLMKVVHGVVVERSARMKERLLLDHVTAMVARRAPGAQTKIKRSHVGPRMRRMMMDGPLSAANAKASCVA